MQTLFNDIQNYWTRRSATYSISNNREYDHWQNQAYTELFTHHLPKKQNLKILDIGCGPGFFSMILSAMGHRVTGIDLTEEMLMKAANNLLAHRLCGEFLPMNAQALDFEDQSFDVAVTRNLTWNLPDPCAAYAEWHRVLKPGGILLNFDANWYRYLYHKDTKQRYLRDRRAVGRMGYDDPVTEEMRQTMETIALELPLSRIERPEWDRSVLMKTGFSEVVIDETIGSQIHSSEEQQLFRTASPFLVIATK